MTPVSLAAPTYPGSGFQRVFKSDLASRRSSPLLRMSLAPSYSSEPSSEERRLGIAVQGPNDSTGSFGTLVQRSNGIAIALKNQQEDARRAVYGRNASVAGEISLSTTQGVASVEVIVSCMTSSRMCDLISIPLPVRRKDNLHRWNHSQTRPPAITLVVYALEDECRSGRLPIHPIIRFCSSRELCRPR